MDDLTRLRELQRRWIADQDQTIKYELMRHKNQCLINYGVDMVLNIVFEVCIEVLSERL